MLIPIFPLSIVQFPGVITPLHIFEPRYRQLMEDIMPTDRTFGIIYSGEDENEPPTIGQIGCTVEVLQQEKLPDGRSNILCVGKERFTVQSLNHDEPYMQASIEYFSDELPAQDMQEKLTTRARDFFIRIINAGKKLRDNEASTSAVTPELPLEAAALSFVIAASLDVPLAEKQHWLEMRSTNRRLSILNNHLSEIVEMYELKAQVHKIAKANGQDGKPPLA